MYDEAADFAEQRTQVQRMDDALAEVGVSVDWPSAVICDVGGGGGLHAGLLASRVLRAHCADVIDQHARYNGEFVKLQAEKFQRHGAVLPIDRYEFNVTDATRMMFRDDWFDFMCSVNAFEHIPDPTQALAEIARVLRPGAPVYLSFDPIWTADTGSHFERYVPEPWAHLLLDESQFILRMREAGAADWEVEDFRWSMNHVRLPVYERLFRVRAGEMGLDLLLFRSWSGTVHASHLEHPNFARALETYAREELLTRGMTAVLRKRPARR